MPGYCFPASQGPPRGFCSCQQQGLTGTTAVLTAATQNKRAGAMGHSTTQTEVTQALLQDGFRWRGVTTSHAGLVCWAFSAVLPAVPGTTPPLQLRHRLVGHCVPRSETRLVSANTESILSDPQLDPPLRLKQKPSRRTLK